jgi:NADPH:quinone reductase-like Zn-dependent oxidoreductase
MNKKMRAAVLVRTGKVSNAFEIREISIPECSDNFVCIAVEAFGLNFADVMARKGQYRDAPPIPSVLGYDVCGRIVAVGKNVSLHKVGDRVTALTRFGGYAEFAVTEERAAVKITMMRMPALRWPWPHREQQPGIALKRCAVCMKTSGC